MQTLNVKMYNFVAYTWCISASYNTLRWSEMHHKAIGNFYMIVRFVVFVITTETTYPTRDAICMWCS